MVLLEPQLAGAWIARFSSENPPHKLPGSLCLPRLPLATFVCLLSYCFCLASRSLIMIIGRNLSPSLIFFLLPSSLDCFPELARE